MCEILTSMGIRTCKPLGALVLSVMLSLAICPPLRGTEYYNFRNLTWQDGLSSSVSCILAEDKGFVWVGTLDGLVRFDGNSVQTYAAMENRKHSLPSNSILQAVRDSLENVWVVTSCGAALYCAETDDFVSPNFEPEEFAQTVRSACVVPGGVLFGAQNRIYKYDYSTGRIRLYARFRTDLTPYFIIEALAPLSDGTMLCFSRRNGILVVIPSGDDPVANCLPFPCDMENSGMMVDSQQRVWISPYNRGIECYNTSGELLASYNMGNSALANDIVLCMGEKDGKIWLGTDGGGINVLDPQTGGVSTIKHISGNHNSLPDNSIKSLHFDRCGNIWAGRVKGGLCVIRKSGICHYSDCQLRGVIGLSEKDINCIYQDPFNNSVWVGTNGEGINLLNPVTNSFTHYPETFKMKVTSITSVSETELLLSTFSQGLFIFNKRNGGIIPLNINDKGLDYYMHYSGKSVNLLRESNNSVLILADSLYRYHTGTAAVEIIDISSRHTAGSLQSVDGNGIKSWVYDSQGIYEIGVASKMVKPLFAFDADTLINSVFLGKGGNFWIASNYGIGCYNPEIGKYGHLKTTLFSSVKSVVGDLKGRLWIGTNSEVFVYLPDTGFFVILGESDGVEQDEYKQKARLCAVDGDIYMGGVKGLLRIDADFEICRQEDFDIVITDVDVDGQRVNGKILDGILKIPHGSKLVRIKVMACEDDIFRKKMYMFRVTGLFDEPVQTYSPEIELRSLSSGSYTVDVSCITADGRWLPWKGLMTLHISQALYRRVWFWILCLIAASGMTYSFLKNRNPFAVVGDSQNFAVGEASLADGASSGESLSPDEVFIRKLDRLIEDNIENTNLDVSYLCKEMFMSRTVMYNKLKVIKGDSIRDYINKIRMEKALELVRDTKLPFSEISEKTGFSTSRYFSTAFKNYTGYTPSEYRSAQEGKKTQTI